MHICIESFFFFVFCGNVLILFIHLNNRTKNLRRYTDYNCFFYGNVLIFFIDLDNLLAMIIFRKVPLCEQLSSCTNNPQQT